MSIIRASGPGNLPDNVTFLTTVKLMTAVNATTAQPFLRRSCDPDKLMGLLVSLQIADPENIVKLAYKKDLSTFCNKVGKRLGDAFNYMSNCILTSDQRLYSNLISGVDSLHQTLCLNMKYKRAFEQYADCYRKLYSDVDNCDGPKDWAEDTNKTRLCKAYGNIIDCYVVKTALLCGPKAAEVFKRLMINVLRTTVVTDCGIRVPRSDIFGKENAQRPFINQKVFNIISIIIIATLLIALFVTCIKK